MISKETIDKVVEACDIHAVVGDYLKLRKQGVNYSAPCPFHDEKSASFIVSPVKGICKCFGCGKGGDSVWFVMNHNSWTYPEAIKYLANKFKVEFVQDELSDEETKKHMAIDSLYVLNDMANSYFIEKLRESPDAVKYFTEARGFTEETIVKWKLGLATENFRGLYEHAIAKKFSHDKLLEANLVIERDGKIFDKFRDRVTYPIFNLSGRITGYTARIFKSDNTQAKYINTAETALYHKREQLFGINFAKQAMSKKNKCYLTEGQHDVITSHQFGFDNTCASSGTALTDIQVKTIGRFTKNLVILYDGDSAGIKATGSAIEAAIEGDLHVRIVVFDGGDDPDSFLRKYGPEAYKKKIDEELDIVQFFFRNLNSLSPEERDERGVIVLKLIAKIPQAQIFRINAYIEKLCALFKASIPGVKDRVRKLRDGMEIKHLDFTGDNVVIRNSDCEMAFVKSLIKHGDKPYVEGMSCYWYMMTESGGPERFNNELPKKIFNMYLDELGKGFVPNFDVFLKCDDKEISDVAAVCELESTQLSESWKDDKDHSSDYKKEVHSVKTYLRLYKKKEELASLQENLTSEKDIEKITELMERDHELKLQLKEYCRENGIGMH